MIKSTLSRAVLGVLVLVCVPAMAAIPPAPGSATIKIQFGGLESLGADHYQVQAGAIVTVAAQAAPGDFIVVMAAVMDANGNPDKAHPAKLLANYAPRGFLSGAFLVPKDFGGKSFMVGAVNWSSLSGWGTLQTVKVDVLKTELPKAVQAPLIDR